MSHDYMIYHENKWMAFKGSAYRACALDFWSIPWKSLANRKKPYAVTLLRLGEFHWSFICGRIGPWRIDLRSFLHCKSETCRPSVYASTFNTLWCNRSRCPTVEPSNARMQNRESYVPKFCGQQHVSIFTGIVYSNLYGRLPLVYCKHQFVFAPRLQFGYETGFHSV